MAPTPLKAGVSSNEPQHEEKPPYGGFFVSIYEVGDRCDKK